MPFSATRLSLSFAFLLLAAVSAQSAVDLNGRVLVGYFPEWGVYIRNYHVTNIPAAKLTHVHYAFLRPVYDGEAGTGRIEFVDQAAAIENQYPGDSDAEPFHGNLNQLLKLKQAHPHLKTVLAVGGVTLSRDFSDIAAAPLARQTFAESCRDFMVQYGFDGIDIDWEFPVEGGAPDVIHRPQDAANLVLLMAKLRQVLDAQESLDGREYLLTMEVSTTKSSLDERYDIPAMIGSVDWIHIMAYAMSGPWAPVTGHQAPLYGNPRSPYGDFHAAEPVVHLLNQGIPARKLVLGVPFYGQGFKEVGSTQNGLYQPHGGESTEGTWSPGIFAYHDLRDGTRGHRYLNSGGFGNHWDPAGHAPYLYNPDLGVFITYENPRALKLKGEFVKKLDLGGMMCWALDFDSADHELVGSMHDALAHETDPSAANRVVCEIDYDQLPPAWSYSYAYAGYGGGEFSERLVPVADLPNTWEVLALPAAGGSQVLQVTGDFTAVPKPGDLTEDEFLINYSYAGLGAGGGSQTIASSNLVSSTLADYSFSFSATIPSGFVAGESTASGTWKLELQAPDDTLSPPDANTTADTIIAFEAEFAALPSVMTPFEFRLDEATIVSGSTALLDLHRSTISQANINFNFWAVHREFGFDDDNTVALDDLRLQYIAKPVRLQISSDSVSGDIVVAWEGPGQLERATTVNGEFVPVENVENPFIITPFGDSAFFRVSNGSP